MNVLGKVAQELVVHEKEDHPALPSSLPERYGYPVFRCGRSGGEKTCVASTRERVINFQGSVSQRSLVI